MAATLKNIKSSLNKKKRKSLPIKRKVDFKLAEKLLKEYIIPE